MMFEEWVPKHTLSKNATLVILTITSADGDTDLRGRPDVHQGFRSAERAVAGEVNDIRASLPSAIREIWPAP
jgi:uncharacterized protein (DUF2267 family)